MADEGGLENAISKLMANPTLMAAVNEAISGMKVSQTGGTSDGQDDGQNDGQRDGHNDGQTEAAGGFGATDTSAVRDDGHGGDGRSAPGGIPFDPSVLAAFSSMLGGMNIGQGGSRRTEDEERKRRCALLSALKPYLNPHRRETIDYMLGIDRLSDALRTVKKT